jgi:hypothetical protein
VLAFSHYERMFPGLPTFAWETWLGNNVPWFVHLWETWLGNNVFTTINVFSFLIGNYLETQSRKLYFFFYPVSF